MQAGSPIPDRRRTRFALNGGPKPTERQRFEARKGIAAARAALEAVDEQGPSEPTIAKRLTAEQKVRARRGIAQARQALQHRSYDGQSAGNEERRPLAS